MNEIKLTIAQREELIKNIIQDSVMWERVSAAMNTVQKTFSPKAEPWEAEMYFNSVYNAFPLMGLPSPKTIKEEEKTNPITYKLQDIFHNAIKENDARQEEYQKNASDLAEVILLEWKSFLREQELQQRLAS